MATYALSSLMPDSTKSFMFAGDTVVAVRWASSGFPPSGGMTVRRYSGVPPPNFSSQLGYTNFYTQITSPFGSYAHDLRFKYKEMWLNNVSGETNLRIARRDTAGFLSWIPFTLSLSTPDTVNNNIFVPTNFDFGYNFTGTDNLNPLPVRLNAFTATKQRDNIILNWATAQEINSSVFVIERSYNGKSFEPIAKVKAAGNSSNIIKYSHADYNPKSAQKATTVYYRLKMVDIDETFEYSKTVVVSFKESGSVNVYPNPFNSDVAVALESETETTAKIQVFNITGTLMLTKTAHVKYGNNELFINELGSSQPGIYLINVMINGADNWFKVVKE